MFFLILKDSYVLQEDCLLLSQIAKIDTFNMQLHHLVSEFFEALFISMTNHAFKAEISFPSVVQTSR